MGMKSQGAEVGTRNARLSCLDFLRAAFNNTIIPSIFSGECKVGERNRVNNKASYIALGAEMTHEIAKESLIILTLDGIELTA